MATCTLDRPAARRARLPCLAAPTGGRIVRTPSPKAESSPVDLPAPLSAFSPAFIYLLGIDFKVYLLYIPSRDILGGTEGWTVGNSGAWKSQRRCRFDGTPRVGSFPRRAALAPTGWCLTPQPPTKWPRASSSLPLASSHGLATALTSSFATGRASTSSPLPMSSVVRASTWTGPS